MNKHELMSYFRIPTLLLFAALLLTGCDSFSAGADNSRTSETSRQPAERGEHNGHDEAGHASDEHDDVEKGELGSDHAEGESGHDGHGEENPDSVKLSAEQFQQLDIAIGQAESGTASASIQAPATLHFDADRVARVGPRLQAKVVKVTADLGEAVSRGETLAVLDSVALGKEKAAYLTAAARFNTRQAAYARDRKLAADQIVSDSDLAESRAAYEQAKAERRAKRAELKLYGLDNAAVDAIRSGGDEPLSRLELVAPRDGVVAKRDLVAGQTLSANETPIHVVDNTRMWLMIDAAEQALPYLKKGQKVSFTVRPLPDESFIGVIDWISPQLDEQARTVRVRAVVENPDGLLRAGMFADADIDAGASSGKRSRIALVPVDAVQQIGEREGVFLPAGPEGAYTFQPVSTGSENQGQVEIRQGIQAGDTLVVRGAFDLKAALTAGGRSAAHGH